MIDEPKTSVKRKRLKLPGKDTMILLILGGALIVIVAWPNSKDKNNVTNDTQSAILDSTESSIKEDKVEENQNYQYTKEMESRLEDILSQIDGVGRVKVMITLYAKEEQVIEKDKEFSTSRLNEGDTQGGKRDQLESSNQEETIYFTTQDGRKEPFVVKIISPIPEGVLVVAEGGSNPMVNAEITNAIQALFPIEAHKIKVVKMKL